VTLERVVRGRAAPGHSFAQLAGRSRARSARELLSKPPKPGGNCVKRAMKILINSASWPEFRTPKAPGKDHAGEHGFGSAKRFRNRVICASLRSRNSNVQRMRCFAPPLPAHAARQRWGSGDGRRVPVAAGCSRLPKKAFPRVDRTRCTASTDSRPARGAPGKQGDQRGRSRSTVAGDIRRFPRRPRLQPPDGLLRGQPAP
jgi:hypothetical protein